MSTGPEWPLTPRETIRLELDEPHEFVSIPRCCATPLPDLGQLISDLDGRMVMPFRCMHCRTEYGDISWRRSNGREGEQEGTRAGSGDREYR